jgi:hypothetical protein
MDLIDMTLCLILMAMVIDHLVFFPKRKSKKILKMSSDWVERNQGD